MQNAQWVKPLFPGDIPEGTTAVWNSKTAEWEFVPIAPQPPEVPPLV